MTLDGMHEKVNNVRLHGVHTRLLARKALAVAVIGVGLTAKRWELVRLGLFALGVKAGSLAYEYEVADAVFKAVEVDLEDGG
jgi:hypothetical protein